MSMKMKFQLDPSEFNSTIKQYAKVSKKDFKDIVIHRAKNVANTRLPGVLSLWGEFSRVTPTISKLRQLPRLLNYRIKRKKGTTIRQEIKRRIKARYAAASGWLPAVKRLNSKGIAVVKKKKNPKGHVEINLRQPSITLVNSMKEAGIAENKYHLMQQVINSHVADMKKYIQDKLAARSKQFSAK